MTKKDRKQEPGPRKAVRIAAYLCRPFTLNERQQRYALMFGLALVLMVIIIPKGGFIPDYYAPGDIASRDIKAPKDLLIPDLPLTEKKRAEAEDAVLPLYDFDARTGEDIAGRLTKAIRQAHAGTGKTDEDLHKAVEGPLGVSLSDDELKGLTKVPASEEFLAHLHKVVVQALDRKVVGNLQLFQADRERGITIRDLVTQKEHQETKLDGVVGIGQVQDLITAGLKKIPHFSAAERKSLFVVVQKVLLPNLTFNKNETEARKAKAREAVKPVLFQIKKGEMIVREGERVTEDQIKKLKALRELGNDSATMRNAAGLLLFILLLLFTTHRFAIYNIRKYRPQNRDLLFLVTTFVGLFVLIKLAIFMSTALESAFPYIDSSSYYYLFPFAVGAMLVRIVLNSEVAFIFAIVSSLLCGIFFGNLILTIQLLVGRAYDIQLLFKLGFGLAGGILCAVIVNGTIPLVESVFKYTTDIKLLELANMNTPVLRELMIQAPGTYHHSIIVGNLVEAAAEAINANPLLARVAAYYHDIGKIRKPLYFVENIGGQENRHDKLTPSMSSLILMSHVKDGVELAKENKLGQVLVEIIRQHHGSALIKFFYDKAKSKEDPGVQQVDERDYRYPGPRPQTRGPWLTRPLHGFRGWCRRLSTTFLSMANWTSAS
ncbi:MAG: HDIG domain-containing protein [Desulfuromonadales bacterium]